MRWPWIGVVALACAGGKEGDTWDAVPGGAELWSGGGTTGARPIVLVAGGNASCGRSGDLLDLDLDGVVDLALLCAATDGSSAGGTSTVSDRDVVRVWSGAAALAGRVVELGRSATVTSWSFLVTVPDLDKDGVDELSVQPRWPTGGGPSVWARVLSGGDLDGPGYSMEGVGTGNPVEPTGLPAGDHDADGVQDLVIAGSPSSATLDQGVFVVSGATVPGSPRVDDAPLRAWTVSPGEEGSFGDVTPVGDLDGDGLPDLVTTSEGEIRVLFGASGGGRIADAPSIATPGTGREGSVSVTSLADLDGDGADELVIAVHRFDSSEDEETWVAIVPGEEVTPVAALSFDAYVIETGPDSQGRVLACDLDGDGLDDLVTGRGWYPGASPILIPMPDAGRVAEGVCAGDLDGDGRSEVVVPTLYPSG